MKLKSILIILLLLLIFPLFGQSDDLRNGLTAYQNQNYIEALRSFREIIIDETEGELDDAYFWSIKSFFALGELEQAEKSIEFFLLSFKDSPYYPEIFYHKGRLLYISGEYDKSIQVLYNFLNNYPNSSFVANAYFWVGESLYNMGQLTEAATLMEYVVSEYPNSFKVEAAQYRIELINLKQRENELLRLLKMSHEDYLKALEEFQKRESTYEQAIQAYQKRVSALDNSEKDQQIASLLEQLTDEETETEILNKVALELKDKVAGLEDQIASLQAKITEYENAEDDVVESVEEESVTLETSAITLSDRLLTLKANALDLKEDFLNALLKELE